MSAREGFSVFLLGATEEGRREKTGLSFAHMLLYSANIGHIVNIGRAWRR